MEHPLQPGYRWHRHAGWKIASRSANLGGRHLLGASPSGSQRRQHTLGGYESWRSTSSYLEVQASQKMTEALLEMLAEVAK